jgi:hypothetical protein
VWCPRKCLTHRKARREKQRMRKEGEKRKHNKMVIVNANVNNYFKGIAMVDLNIQTNKIMAHLYAVSIQMH